MRRSFKLATVFTGVAAVAGGVGPAMLAAPAHASSTKNQICGANNGGISEWFHVFYPNDDHPAECFHNRGVEKAKALIHSYCGGNNYGEIFGSLSRAGYYHTAFRQGTTRAQFSGGRGNFSLSEVAISGWAGTDKCLG